MNIFSNPIHFKRSDLLELHLHNYVKSSGSCSEKGNPVSDNQDALFKYEHFLLIRNFSVFGVCDGHGKNGKLISEAIIRLFPAYMHYLTMDNDLITKGHDINNLILSLFKIQEKPDVLDVNVIRYFYNKCELIYKNIPFIKKSLSEIHSEISEAFYRTHIDIKERLKIDHDTSGSTVCTIFVYDNILYCANIGDSRALMCSYIFNRNKWECKQLTIDHKPNVTAESNRIRVLNGKVERAKDDKGEPVGPFRVWYKDSSTTINTEGIGPGLAMSRSIGDASAKAIGVCCEPELFEYHLHRDNKFIVIGTDGLWDNLTNEEVLCIGSECYDMKEKAEYIANMLVNKAKQNASQRKESKLLEQGYNKNTKNTNVSSVIDDITCWVIYLNVKNDDEI